jgi:hypothetical protein
MAKVLGYDGALLFYFGGQWLPISCLRAATLATELQLIEISNTQSGKWSEFRGKRLSAKLDFDGLTTIDEPFTVSALRALQFDIQPVNIIMQVVDLLGNNVSYQFTAIGQSISETISQADAGTFNASMQVTGGITLLYNFTPSGGNIMRLQDKASGGETQFTFTTLIGRTVVSVARDGQEYYLVGGTPSIDKEARFDSTTGTIFFDQPFNIGEQLIVLYQ